MAGSEKNDATFSSDALIARGHPRWAVLTTTSREFRGHYGSRARVDEYWVREVRAVAEANREVRYRMLIREVEAITAPNQFTICGVRRATI
jgi:hypothetical protein